MRMDALHVRLAFVAGCALEVLSGCAAESARAEVARKNDATPVRLAPVLRGEVARPIKTFGVVEAKSRIDLAFKVGGIVQRVNVDVGTRVKKGAVLASIDRTEVLVEEARASEAIKKAERDLARLRDLHALRSAPWLDVQNAQTTFELATAARTLASYNVKHSELVAPDDGIIEFRALDLGEVVAPGQRVLQLVGASRGLIVKTQIPESEILGLRLGQKARVVLDVSPDQVFEGHISSIARVSTPSTGAFAVDISFDTPVATSLPAGLSAKVELDRSETPSAVVPLESLIEGDGRAGAVFVVNDGKAKRLPVSVSFVANGQVGLSSAEGLAQWVVDRGADQLVDGSAVVVVP
ncbi:MAG: efflux RND transporter periplasmic adaptor subunit [Myxococcales bacterium]